VKLATIDYENDTQAGAIERLKAAGVEIVLDVRAVASSRKAGFSKTILAASLAEAGIDYLHLQKLGTPKAGRLAARAGRFAEMREIYDGHLADEPAAQIELAKAGEIATARKAALLCYEADHTECHRSIVAQRLTEALGLEVENL
jgi:uncharacterized protein (DUF488 family)